MKKSSHLPKPFTDGTYDGLSECYRLVVDRQLPGLAEWCLLTVTGVMPAEAPGWRDLYWSPKNDKFVWHHPWSNSPERIQTLLWLHSHCCDARFLRAAIHYAEAMLNDHKRGIYQGEEEEGHGMVWYWNESGAFVTNYTIRVAPAFLALYEQTGRPEFEKAALLSGEALLQRQTPYGILREGWLPRNMDAMSRQRAEAYLTETKINSRVGYVSYTLALLYKHTRDLKWLTALEKFLASFLCSQWENGAFPEDILVNEKGYLSPWPKGHFHSYILYGLSQTAMLLPELEVVRHAAVRLADYMISDLAVVGSCLYGDLRVGNDAEAKVWRTATPDAAAGLAMLYRATGDKVYEKTAQKILLDALLSRFNRNCERNLIGGLPVWHRREEDPNGEGIIPAFSGYYSFWTLLGIQALDD